MNKIKVQENYLSLEDFNILKKGVTSTEFPWFSNSILDNDIYKSEEKYNHQLCHIFYKNYNSTSQLINLISPLIQKINPVAILRIKANLTTQTDKQIFHGFHNDFDFDCTTSIFYVNSNNGETVFEDGTKIKSIENTLVSFPSKMKHSGTTTTDSKIRIVLNLNYLEK